MTQAREPGWNPLRCSGTILPANLLLMAKLIALCLLLIDDSEWRRRREQAQQQVENQPPDGAGQLADHSARSRATRSD